MSDKTDTIYQNAPGRPFRFNAAVADVFPDMINRSVPGYASVLEMLGVFARRYVTAGSRCYDLGCSLGAATLAMRHQITHPDVTMIAVDNSEAMVERCRQIVDRDRSLIPVSVRLGDICEIDVENASMSVLNYTLQFVARERRLALLKRVARGTLPGGILVLAEKVRFEESPDESLLDELHLEFKRSQGYSELEIARKRQALENVLVRDSLDEHRQRLLDAGFSSAHVWFQHLNFAALVAIR